MKVVISAASPQPNLPDESRLELLTRDSAGLKTGRHLQRQLVFRACAENISTVSEQHWPETLLSQQAECERSTEARRHTRLIFSSLTWQSAAFLWVWVRRLARGHMLSHAVQSTFNPPPQVGVFSLSHLGSLVYPPAPPPFPASSPLPVFPFLLLFLLPFLP